MSVDIREYLLERFSEDASTLRKRAAAMQGSRTAQSGPGSAVSSAMADACDEVVKLATTLPEDSTVDEIVAALRAMIPGLERLAASKEAETAPPVRAVYLGAIKRVQELIAAETRAPHDGAVDDEDDEQ
ncbi:MAG: hypothetical protein ACO1Q7_00050 [Gemmatimonas sp.]